MIVIWAHSLCRSTYALYTELSRLASVRLVALEGVPAYRRAQGVDEKEFTALDFEILGENLMRADAILKETCGATHLVAAYQVSPTMRHVALEAKARGDKVFIISEEPWNALSGFKRYLWPIYLRTALKLIVKDVINKVDGFIDFSGDMCARAKLIGWTEENIHSFGYFPAPLVEGAAREPKLPLKVFAPATLGRAGRGEKTILKAFEGLEDFELKMPNFLIEEEVKSSYLEADIVISAGEDEPWGVRVNDAINAGAVVLVSCGMGVEKIVRETGCGIVFDNADSLRAALLEVKANYSKYAANIDAAKSLISPKENAAKLLSILSTPRKHKILHLSWGLEPNNGAANIARMIMSEQIAAGHEARIASKFSFRELREADELWCHCGWYWRIWLSIAYLRLLKRSKPVIKWMPECCYDPIRLAYHGWKKRLVGPIERWALRRVDAIVATCEAEAEWCRAYLGPACPEIELTDIKRFFKLPTTNNPPPLYTSHFNFYTKSPIHVMYLGRPHPLKGVEYLRAAVSSLQAEGKSIELREVTNHFGSELEADWEWCDVMCLPTLSDNLGLVVAEALERGKRVITTDGAPAWAGFSDIIYLEGYRHGSGPKRVELLKSAFNTTIFLKDKYPRDHESRSIYQGGVLSS